MNVRIRGTGILLVTLLMGGCASGGGGGAESTAPVGFQEDDLPAWVLALPEGVEPSENDQTAEASLFLFQATSTSDPARAAGFFQQALGAAQGSISAEPGNPQGYFLAGRAHLGLGDLAQASQMFDEAERIYPRYVVDTEYLREEQWIEEYNAAVAFLPDNVSQAIPLLERANMIHKGRPEAMIQLASAYQQLDRIDDAVALYAQVVALVEGPRGRDLGDAAVTAYWAETREIALYNSAQLLFNASRFPEAAAAYERLVALFPEDVMLVGNYGAALVLAGQNDRAMQVFDQLLSRSDLNARDYFIIGVGLYEANELAQAARAFEQAHRRVPQDREALYNFVQSLYFADMLTELLEPAQALVQIDPNNRNAYSFIAQALVHASREQEAVSFLERQQALPFDVAGLNMGVFPDAVAVAGQATNRNAAPGSTVRLRFHFYDLQGASVGTQDVTVTLGAVEAPVGFQVDLATTRDVIGYRYEVL